MPSKVNNQMVEDALKKVLIPGVNRDIVSLGLVGNIHAADGEVWFNLELSDPESPALSRLRDQAEEAVQALDGVQKVTVKVTSKLRDAKASQGDSSSSQHIPGVRYIIPIASGKGGVGKSTVSANLALALTHLGFKVGVLDADVYGPSIPKILGVKYAPSKEGDRLIPSEQDGVKVISMDFFVPPDDVAILRGPMLHNLLVQFVKTVNWGELDYLLIDLPPGTGDVQLSLCQMLSLSGAVVISTPQDVAMRIAQKAIIMFRKLHCPVLGIIENMSRYVCSHCGREDSIFGENGAKNASLKLQIPFFGDIPLHRDIRLASDKGKSLVLSDRDSVGAKAFASIAEKLVAEVKLQESRGVLSEDIELKF